MVKIWIEFTDDFGHSTQVFDGCVNISNCKTVRGVSVKVREAINAYPGTVEANWAIALEKERQGDR